MVFSSGLVTLTLACPNACVFCAQQGLASRPERSPEEVRAALRALRQERQSVVFAGGEPGLLATLEGHVRAAREEGFLRVGVQTNGAGLVDVERLRGLAGAGLTDVHLSVHGADAAVHDYHTGAALSFERAQAALAAARVAGLPVSVTTVLTRSNFRALDRLATWLVARGAAAWCVSVPLVVGRAQVSFDRVVPRLGLALPFALRALVAARARGLAAFISGAPLCLLGPHGAISVAGAESRAYGAPCAECPARGACPGVDAAYLERFDGDELAPRGTIVVPPVDESARRHAAMFLGVGERAAVHALVATSSPVKARRALPTLGRGQPAAAEVGRGERRTGEALRALFPTLFDGREVVSDDLADGEPITDDGTREPND